MQAPPASGGGWLASSVAWATGAFCLLTLLGLVATPVRYVLWVYDLALFLVGIAGFVVGIVLAGARALSGVSVRASGLFLAGFAPPREQRLFRWSLAATIVVGLGGAIVTSVTKDVEPLVYIFPATAFGILVPIFPPALAGVHGARYCAWPLQRPSGGGA